MLFGRLEKAFWASVLSEAPNKQNYIDITTTCQEYFAKKTFI